MSVSELRKKFDRIDAEIPVDKSVDGFSEDFVKGISRVLGGEKVD
jgi:hypothetical protein